MVKYGRLFVEVWFHRRRRPVQKFDFIHSFREVKTAMLHLLYLYHANAAPEPNRIAVTRHSRLPVARRSFLKSERFLGSALFISVPLLTFGLYIFETIVRAIDHTASIWADLRITLACNVVKRWHFLHLRRYLPRPKQILLHLLFYRWCLDHSRILFLVWEQTILRITDGVLARLDLLAVWVDVSVGAVAVREVWLVEAEARGIWNGLSC